MQALGSAKGRESLRTLAPSVRIYEDPAFGYRITARTPGLLGNSGFEAAAPNILEFHCWENFPLSDGIGCPKTVSAVTGDR